MTSCGLLRSGAVSPVSHANVSSETGGAPSITTAVQQVASGLAAEAPAGVPYPVCPQGQDMRQVEYLRHCEEWASQGEPEEERQKALVKIRQMIENGSKELDIGFLKLATLPPLSEDLITLNCSCNPIRYFPEKLPPLLQKLECFNCKLYALPESLQRLNCGRNSLTSLPSRMPETLIEILCFENQIKEIKLNCPGLESLNCSKNKIKSLIVSSECLKVLKCSNNDLTEIPDFSGLNVLDCKNNPFFLRHLLWNRHGRYSLLKNHMTEFMSSCSSLGSVSRSLLNPQALFDSCVVSLCEGKLDGLTFGIEVEGYHYNIIQQIENIFGQSGFSCVTDSSLFKYILFLSNEWVSGILRSTKDLKFTQNYLSVLNDFGCFSDSKSGVHIHFGVSQFSEKTIDSGNAIYNEKSKVFRPTNFQLDFAKQFLVNFASIQGRLSSILRESVYAVPIAKDFSVFLVPGKMDGFINKISECDNFDSMMQCIDSDSGEKYTIINLHSFKTKGTFEFRGATKVFSSFMEVDPNLPIADIAFLQDLIGLSLEGARKTFNNENPLSVCEGVEEIADRYVQTTLMLGVVHALLQRDQCRRFETMKTLLGLRKFMSTDTLETLSKLFGQLPDTPTDPLRQDFTALILQHQALDPIPWGTSAELDTHAIDFCTKYHNDYGLLTSANMDVLANTELPESAVNPFQPGSPRRLANVLFGTETLGLPQEPPSSGTSA